jgi:DNA-binding transcriptional LysR family regulator
VAPFLPEFLARYPDIRVEMEMSNRMVDLAQEGWDVVLRLSRSIGPNLVARSLAGVRWFLCGHEDYLRRHGEPRVPADLAGHNCLVLAQRASGEQWVFAGPTGEESVAVSGSLTVDNPETLRHALLAGVGISLLPDFVVGADIRAGRLRVLLPDHAPRSRYGDGVWAVYLSNRQLSPKVRVFIDFLLEKYGSVPYWA